jgi:hypothetical protein
MMLARALAALTLVTGTALAFPAAVGDSPKSGGLPIQDLKRGASLDVICPHIEQMRSDDVSVIMYPGPDDTTSGVAGVLVTERTIDSDVVHVRVPNIPDLKDHIVRMKVFYLDDAGKHACDAGRIRLL